jgi:imidazolonepropionase-like amidohydrolase
MSLRKQISAAFLLVLVASALSAPGVAAQVRAITGGTLITPVQIMDDAVILIEGEKIVKTGRAGQVQVPDDADRIDAKGKWVIPGLIDGHVHFFQSGGLYTRPDVIDLREHRPYGEEIAWIRDNIEDTFRRYLMSGVTSVVDLGGPLWTFEVRERAEKVLEAPRVAVTGPLISTYQPGELSLEDPPIIKVESPEEGRALVKSHARHKPEMIKIWFIVRFGEEPKSHLPIIRAIIDESHGLGLRVVVHATEYETARAAVEAGADILAHSVDDRRVDGTFVELLKKRNVIYIPTLLVSMRYDEVLSQQISLTAPERRIANPHILNSLQDLQKLPESLIPESVRRRMRSGRQVSADPVAMNNLKVLQDAGVTIAMGSDAGNIGTPHGPAVFRELELMEQAGLSAREIITAATLNGARLLGMEDQLGSIEEGKLADLLILNSNPLTDIRNTSDIHMVIKGGTAVELSSGTD